MFHFPFFRLRILAQAFAIAALCLCFVAPSVAPARADEAPPVVAPVTVPPVVAPPADYVAPAKDAKDTPMKDAPAKGKPSSAKMRQMRFENAVRGVMTQTGFPDAALQDAIIAHMENESRARGPLRQSGEKLFRALQSPLVADEKVSDLLKNFQAALDADDKRRDAAEAALDLKIAYAKNPRLQSMLLLFGIIGDGALFVPLREPPRESLQNKNGYAPQKTPFETPSGLLTAEPRRPEHATEYPAGGRKGQ